jgi:hypothetical protein
VELKLQLVAVIASGALLLLILELVRQRRLLERYALLWLFSSIVLLGLAIWNDALTTLSNAIGVATPSNALFLIAFGFVLVLLLHFSIAVSRQADQTKILAQRLAILEERHRAADSADSAPDERGEYEYAGRDPRE